MEGTTFYDKNACLCAKLLVLRRKFCLPCPMVGPDQLEILIIIVVLQLSVITLK